MTDPTVSLLRDLVAIDSVNPGLVPGAAGEAEIGRRIELAFRQIGLDVHTAEVAPGRRNVVGVLEGARPGPALMLCGHMDTVGVDGMVAPFEPRVDGDRLYGRGSQDMKSGLAAMIGAAGRLAGRLPSGRLLVAAVVDEEDASAGAEALVGDWSADAAVVTEPTGLRLATAHKGFAWVEVETRGRAAHGSRPREGRDAIMMMGRVLSGLAELGRELMARPEHGLLGTPSLHASTIRGGREPSIYPESCTLTAERRTVVGEPDGVALDEVQMLLARLAADQTDLEAIARPLVERPPYKIPAHHPLVRECQTVLAARGLSAEPTGMSYWTDAAILARGGTPTVLFGPTGAGLHGTEEYVEIASVLTCQEVLVDLARRFCGNRPLDAGA